MDYEDYVCGNDRIYDYEADLFTSKTSGSWNDTVIEDYWEEDQSYDAQYLEKLDNYDSIFNWQE